MNRASVAQLALIVCVSLTSLARPAQADTTLIGGSVNNGNLDRSHAAQVAPGFFLPQPSTWVFRAANTISGPTSDGLSSEPWAGPAPTPVTTDGNLNPPSPEGFDGPDGAAFYKAFTGNVTSGPITIDLYQDFPATPGLTYTFTGWAGAETNMLGTAEFSIDFLNASNVLIGSSTLVLNTAGLYTPNGQPFNYKQYTVNGTAPAGAATVRARSSLVDGLANPLGGGQAYVVDDFTFTVPEPSSIGLLALGLFAISPRRRRQTIGA